jgi:hypothetical protein
MGIDIYIGRRRNAAVVGIRIWLKMNEYSMVVVVDVFGGSPMSKYRDSVEGGGEGDDP